MAGVCDSFSFPGPHAPCWYAGLEVHSTGTLDPHFHSDTPAAGEIGKKMGQGKTAMLTVCSKIPPWTTVVYGLWTPLEHQCPCVTWIPGMLEIWGLQPSDHLWRKPKAYRQVPYPWQSLKTNQGERCCN